MSNIDEILRETNAAIARYKTGPAKKSSGRIASDEYYVIDEALSIEK